MVTLEHLKERHDQAATPAIAQARRKQARDLAATLKIPIPEWARMRERPRPNFSARAPRLHHAPIVATRVAQPVQLHSLLSDWCRTGVGRIVRVGQHGVELHEIGQPVRRFASTSAALEALTRP